MKKDEEIVFDTDEGIVEYRTDIEGWVGKNGRYYGKGEQAKKQAIYSNSTHSKCEKGHIFKVFYTSCPTCRELSLPDKYKRLEFKPWDGITPLALFDSDKFFFDEDSIIDYMYDNDLTKDDLKLVYCRPEYLDQVDEEFWSEVLPEDWSLSDVSEEVSQKLKELNKAISQAKVASWWPTNIRTIYDLEPKTGAPM